MLQVLGVPPEELIQTACKRKRFFGELLKSGAVTPHRASSTLGLMRICPMDNVRLFFPSDESGYPRPYTNIKGITRIPGSKDLASVLRSSDPVFVDFVKRCLEYV